MDDIERCNEEFWGARCDRPQGHRTAHSGRKAAARLTWGNSWGHPWANHPGRSRGHADTADPGAEDEAPD